MHFWRSVLLLLLGALMTALTTCKFNLAGAQTSSIPIKSTCAIPALPVAVVMSRPPSQICFGYSLRDDPGCAGLEDLFLFSSGHTSQILLARSAGYGTCRARKLDRASDDKHHWGLPLCSPEAGSKIEGVSWLFWMRSIANYPLIGMCIALLDFQWAADNGTTCRALFCWLAHVRIIYFFGGIKRVPSTAHWPAAALEAFRGSSVCGKNMSPIHLHRRETGTMICDSCSSRPQSDCGIRLRAKNGLAVAGVSLRRCYSRPRANHSAAHPFLIRGRRRNQTEAALVVKSPVRCRQHNLARNGYDGLLAGCCLTCGLLFLIQKYRRRKRLQSHRSTTRAVLRPPEAIFDTRTLWRCCLHRHIRRTLSWLFHRRQGEDV